MLCHARYEFSWWLGEIYWGDFTRIKRKLILQSTNEQIKLYEGSNKTKNKYILKYIFNRLHYLLYTAFKPFTLLLAHIVKHECISILWKIILMLQGNSVWKCLKLINKNKNFRFNMGSLVYLKLNDKRSRSLIVLAVTSWLNLYIGRMCEKVFDIKKGKWE